MDDITFRQAALARLMPMFLVLTDTGVIAAVGPTLAQLIPGPQPVGRLFQEVFQVLRPADIDSISDLAARAGDRLHMIVRAAPDVSLRGLGVPLRGGGLFINLSFGIGVIDAVARHALTDADFAPTDLTVEMLYLVEAKSAVMAELRNLNLRLQIAKKAAEEQALSDTLTGLRNRRALDGALGGLITRGTGFGLMHIDLDYFKQVNDTRGHAAGDLVLREVARVLLAETRSGDIVARVGGDEFVVALPGQSDVTQLAQIAARIIEALTQPIDFEGSPCRISASIGLTVSTHYDHPDADRMLSDADHALYASKHAGRGQAQVFDPKKGDRRMA